MKRNIIITDLTRFENQAKVCTAGVDLNDGACIRPMPYLSRPRCEELGILPGSILTGTFTSSQNRSGPHQEDHTYSGLRLAGAASSEAFRESLQATMFGSVEAGFDTRLEEQQKVIPADDPPPRSLITVRVDPSEIRIVEDGYNVGKIKLHFTDSSSRRFHYIGITDLGFFKYAQEHHSRNDLEALNDFIRSQEEVLLRIGLSRKYRAPDGREGFWIQANGIYTFPDYRADIRSHT